MMVSALTGAPLCEACSDPIAADELELVADEPFHEDCAPARERVLQEA